MLKKLTRDVKASMGIYEAREEQSYGLLAEFSDPAALLHAAEAAREEGYTHFDAHSPFPIHGMDRAMGLGNSLVGYFTLGGGLTGLLVAFLLQWWTSAVDYPINIGGKPFFAWQASVPIMFELTVLFAAFGAVTGMLALNGLPRPYNPLFYSDNFRRATDDGFFLHIAASDAAYEARKAEQFLQGLGALSVETITDRETTDTADATQADAARGEETASEEAPRPPAEEDTHLEPSSRTH